MAQQPRKIELTFSEGGTVELAVKGVDGAACQQESQFLSAALGDVVSDARTDEFYKGTEVVQPNITVSQ